MEWKFEIEPNQDKLGKYNPLKFEYEEPKVLIGKNVFTIVIDFSVVDDKPDIENQ
jgi:hypothetical protein